LSSTTSIALALQTASSTAHAHQHHTRLASSLGSLGAYGVAAPWAGSGHAPTAGHNSQHRMSNEEPVAAAQLPVAFAATTGLPSHQFTYQAGPPQPHQQNSAGARAGTSGPCTGLPGQTRQPKGNDGVTQHGPVPAWRQPLYAASAGGRAGGWGAPTLPIGTGALAQPPIHSTSNGSSVHASQAGQRRLGVEALQQHNVPLPEAAAAAGALTQTGQQQWHGVQSSTLPPALPTSQQLAQQLQLQQRTVRARSVCCVLICPAM
jgi:hypothetical protein